MRTVTLARTAACGEQEFGCEGVADMLAPALVGQGAQVASQEDLAKLVRQGKAVARRLARPQTLPDGSVDPTSLKHRTTQHARRQRKIIEGRTYLVGQGVQVCDGCPCDSLGGKCSRTC
jgi:hypothetical protein